MPKVDIPKEQFKRIKKWKKASGLTWKEIFTNLSANIFEIEEFLKDYTAGTVMNNNTLYTFYDSWLKHYVVNIPKMKEATSYETMKVDKNIKGKKNTPALILGVGPSLEGKWDLIKKFKGCIFCPDRLAVEFYKRDMVPDFIINVDSQEACAKYLDSIPGEWLDKTTLISITTSHPKLVNKFKNIVFINPLLDNPQRANPPSVSRLMLEMCKYIGTDIPAYDILGNVSMAGYQHAQIWGYDPCVFLGVDLGFRTYNGKVNLADSPEFKRLDEKVKSGDITEKEALSCFKERKNPFGNTVWTDFIKGEYIDSAVQAIKYYDDVTTIQCGEYTSFYKGTKCCYFSDYIENQDDLRKLRYINEKTEKR